MKKKLRVLLGFVLLLALTVLVFGSGASIVASDKEADLPGDISEVLDKALKKALQGQGITVEGWPEGKIPAEIPPYQWGKVVNSGGTAEEYIILVETSRDELEEYLKELAALDWYVSDDRNYPSSRLKNITMEFQFNSKTMLQISVYVKGLGAWPENRLPVDIFPPEKGTLIGEVEIYGLGDDGVQYIISYEYDGLSDQDIMDYMTKLMEQGWGGDEYMLSKVVEWNGSRFDAYIEPWYDEGAVSFYCNLFRLD